MNNDVKKQARIQLIKLLQKKSNFEEIDHYKLTEDCAKILNIDLDNSEWLYVLASELAEKFEDQNYES